MAADARRGVEAQDDFADPVGALRQAARWEMGALHLSPQHRAGLLRLGTRLRRRDGAVRVRVPTTAKACHPVLVEVYDPAGRKSRLYSGVCDAKGGAGTYAFRTALNDPAGTWRVVATDYVTGKSSAASAVVAP